MTYARSAKLSCRLVENPRARHDDARQAHLAQNNCLLLQLTLGRLRCVQFYADLHCGSSWHHEMHMEYTAPYHRNTKLPNGQLRRAKRLDYFSMKIEPRCFHAFFVFYIVNDECKFYNLCNISVYTISNNCIYFESNKKTFYGSIQILINSL